MSSTEQELKKLQAAILKLREVKLREPYKVLSAVEMDEMQYLERSAWLRDWSRAFEDMLAAQREYGETLAGEQ